MIKRKGNVEGALLAVSVSWIVLLGVIFILIDTMQSHMRHMTNQGVMRYSQETGNREFLDRDGNVVDLP